jgi:predicted Fe-Mo cluster-binding NifX family protein
MKIILTATSPSIDSNVDARFGRGAYLIVVDPNTLEWQAHPNPGVGASGGAGTLAAQFVANQHASSVISGDFGPNAYNALQAAGIAMYLYGASTTVRQAVEHFKAGQLTQVGAPTGPGHHLRG